MNRVLIVATRQIGDVLLTTPLIRLVRTTWPHAQIDVIGFSGTLGMLRANPDINALIETPMRLGLRGFSDLLKNNWRRYDLGLITQASDRAHLIGFFLAKKRSGIVPPAHTSTWWKRLLLSHAVPSADDLGHEHVVTEKLGLLSPWAAAPEPVQVISPPPSTLPKDLQELLEPGAVVVHAPSMWLYKQWPLEHYSTLIQEILLHGRQVVLTGSNSQRDHKCIEPLLALAASPRIVNMAGRLDFNQLVGLFAQASAYVGPDTSVSHLAAASGIPTVAIFGPTNPQRWSPWPAKLTPGSRFQRSASAQVSGNVILVQSELACVPCGKAGCEDHVNSRSDCLQAITPQQVLQQLLSLLSQTVEPDPNRT